MQLMQLRKKKTDKIQASRDANPDLCDTKVQYSLTNCANKPAASWSHGDVVCGLEAQHLKLMIVKLLILSKLPTSFVVIFQTSVLINLARGIQSSASHRSFLNGSFTQSIFFNPTTQDEIAEIAKTFLPGKAAGYNQIPMTVIKESILLVSEPLTHIINLSIQHGIVPDEMKIARMIPIFKSDDQSLFTNYRPILVLPSFSKFFERVIYNRLMQYLMNFNILCSNQYGFRKNHSTALALIDLHDKISMAFDQGEFSIGIFLDLSKAFDTVNHIILF